MFYDDYLSLADDETTFGAKSDNYLKVCIHSHITCRDPLTISAEGELVSTGRQNILNWISFFSCFLQAKSSSQPVNVRAVQPLLKPLYLVGKCSDFHVHVYTTWFSPCMPLIMD